MSHRLTHLDGQGRASMVDVADKPETVREAVAEACLKMKPNTRDMIMSGEMAKGDVLATARIAGIQAAKKTADLIPLCHPLALTKVAVELSPKGDDQLHISALCRVTGRTGVEMEALTAASVAALTIYDMCKAVDREMIIETVQLQKKSGGRSGDYQRNSD